MLEITINHNRIFFGKYFSIEFMRTIRIPNDGKQYQLPAGLGTFPIYKVSDYINTIPFHWIEEGGGLFIPMYQFEAMWIDFHYPNWRPHAVKIGAGRINIINGKHFSDKLVADTEDYMVSPKQPWIDGFNMGGGIVRQFVATPLGSGKSVEAQITGEEEFGGTQIIVYAPKPGLFPEEAPPATILYQSGTKSVAAEMGLAAGGKIVQKIYADTYGIDTWDQDNYGKVNVHIINSLAFIEATGLQPPSSPITFQLYKDAGIPWYKLYDDELETISSSSRLKNLNSI